MKLKFAMTAAALLLASCGRVAGLEPKTGQALPPKPALAKEALDAEALLKLPTQAAPQRVDELLKKGEPRKPDRFDLPPSSGAPGDPTPDTTGPDNAGDPQ